MPASVRGTVRFPPYHIPNDVDVLHRGDDVVPLEPRAVQLLRFLVANSDRVVSKEELLDRVWPDTFTGDGVVKTAVALVRRALGDDATNARFVATYHGRGYRFVGEVESAEPEPARPPGLPHPATSFVGRDRELGAVRRALASSRLVTLTGMGGIGKSRLALEAATGLGDAFPDGAVLVELGALTDPVHVRAAVATACGVRPSEGGTVESAIADRRVLLVLDNCEHLLDASAALVASLLRACAHVSVLATSREPLRVGGEAIVSVPGLGLPGDPGSSDPGMLVGCDAARLFVARAEATNPGFRLDGLAAIAVARICRRLDGIPLAIEIAASRLRTMPPEQVLERLEDRFSLLVGGDRTAQPRQQTMRAALDWSHALLSDDERILLRRLSIFAGGWTAEGAAAVVPGPRPSEVADLLESLADKSLVVADVSGAKARYRILDTVRAYGSERLDEAAERDDARARHAAHFVELAERLSPQLRGADPGRAYAEIVADLDNLRAALSWCLERDGRENAGLRLASALARIWALYGATREGRAWLDAALARSSGEPPALRAVALYWTGSLSLVLAEMDRARADYDEALSLARDAGDDAVLALVLNGVGLSFVYANEVRKAIEVHGERLALARRLGDQDAAATSLFMLGQASMYGCDFDESERLVEESLAAFRLNGDIRMELLARTVLAQLARHRGDLGRSEALAEATRELVDRLGDRRLLVALDLLRAGTALDRGEHPAALSAYVAVLDAESRGGTWRNVVEALEGAACALAGLGREAVARRLAAAAARNREALGQPVPACDRQSLERWLGTSTFDTEGPDDFDDAVALARSQS